MLIVIHHKNFAQLQTFVQHDPLFHVYHIARARDDQVSRGVESGVVKRATAGDDEQGREERAKHGPQTGGLTGNSGRWRHHEAAREASIAKHPELRVNVAKADGGGVRRDDAAAHRKSVTAPAGSGDPAI